MNWSGETGRDRSMGARMRARTLAALGMAALLAGCGSKEDAARSEPSGGKAPSVEEMKQEAARLVKPEPGLYTRTMTVESLEVPGMPEAAAAQMRAMMGKDRTDSFCLTKEEAEKGFRDMFDNVDEARKCQYDRFSVSGGTLDAQMTCAHASQGTAVMTLNGTASSTSSDVTMTMKVTGAPAPMREMNMKMHMVSARTGDCPS